MSLRSGLAAQLGVARETTWGAFAAPTRHFPLRSESLTWEQERLDSEAIVAGRTLPHEPLWAKGPISVSGGIELDAALAGQALLWQAALGSVSTTGTGPYTHVITPGDLDGVSLSIQVGRPDTGGTVQPFSFLGCKVSSLSLEVETGSLASLSLEVVGRTVSTAEALATPTYPVAPQLLHGHGATVSLGGSAVAAVRSVSLQIENPLSDDRHQVSGAEILEPQLVGMREVTAELEVEWQSLAQWQRFVSADVVALQVTLTPASGSGSLTIDLRGRVDSAGAQVGGPEILTETVTLRAMGTSDAAAITVTVVNDDATP